MAHLILVAEGQTEQHFAELVIAKHLEMFNISVGARLIRTKEDFRRGRSYVGGATSYEKIEKDIRRCLPRSRQADVFVTTMFDLYGFPEDFPRWAAIENMRDPHEIVACLEEEFRNMVGHPRFIPYLQLHEFEALLFSDPAAFRYYCTDREKEIKELVRIAEAFSSPELINMGSDSAPSKRIINLIPEYGRRKAFLGPRIAQRIGLQTIRRRCRHFNEWLSSLEKLGQ